MSIDQYIKSVSMLPSGWDSPVTIEELQTAGFKKDNDQIEGDFDLFVSTESGDRYVLVRIGSWKMLDWMLHCPEGEDQLSGLCRPRIMLDVWRLLFLAGLHSPLSGKGGE